MDESDYEIDLTYEMTSQETYALYSNPAETSRTYSSSYPDDWNGIDHEKSMLYSA
jgi:hypothetical protein